MRLVKNITKNMAWLMVIAATSVHAGGSLYVCNHQQERFPGSGTITLNYDGGGLLGSRNKAQADVIVNSGISVWNNLGSSTISVARGPDLPVDVTFANYLSYVGNTSNGFNPVIYDTDGTILDALLGVGAKGNVYGFGGSSTSNCQFTEGHAIINGLLPISDISLAIVLTHEVGHLIGLDHTQLDNAQGLTQANYPVMYPVLNRSSVTLHEDDVAAVSAIYPSGTLGNAYGQLTGTFTQADGTPILGANLWAKETTTSKVYSIVSDYLVQNTGYFRLLLPAGTYTLHAEAIHSNFNGGSKVGPYAGNYPASLSFQPPMYVGGAPMASVTLGNLSPTTIAITNGCVTASAFKLDGTGSTWGAGGAGGGCALAPPVCTLTVSSKTIIAGSATTLTATCNPVGTSYAWTNSGFAAGLATGSVSPAATTTYAVTGSNAAGSGNTASVTVTVVLPTPFGVQQVSTSGTHTCAVTELGAIRCWGLNGSGQLGDNSIVPRNVPVDLSGSLLGFAAVAVGITHTCGLTPGGGVKCWGDNTAGQIGDASNTQRNTAVDVSSLTSGVVALATGNAHSCALTVNGGVKCWGSNANGQLGDNSIVNRNAPVDVVGLASGVIAIAAGDRHTCALTGSGGVKCWGDNNTGQLGDNTIVQHNTPTDVIGLQPGMVAIATGFGHSCAVTNSGGVKCWGDNTRGQIGDNSNTQRNTAVDAIGLLVGVTSISAGNSHSCALTTAGGVKCWGNNDNGQLGDNTFAQRNSAVDVAGLTANVAAIAAGNSNHSCALNAGGSVKCWGLNGGGQLGDGSNTSRSTPIDVGTFAFALTRISAGARDTCAITTAGGVKCWGFNNFGQLGDNSILQRNAPVDPVGLGVGMIDIATGSGHSCALTNAGGVKCWGDNTNGQIGDNTIVQRLTAVDVNGFQSGVAAVSAGNGHTCALTNSGGVKCWGLNSSGQLGDNTITQRNTAVDVLGLTTGVAAIAAGEHHTCALTTTGGVKCWGLNTSGQLGDNTIAQRNNAVDVSGLSAGVIAIAAGMGHTCALTSGGGVKCWGQNSSGQLGDNTINQSNTPVDVFGLASGIAGIATGNSHSCARTIGGGVKCWGLNAFGQLGDNSTMQRNTAVDVVGLASGVVALSARNGYQTCALNASGEAKCWGFNSAGQVGDNTTTHRYTPVAVFGFAPRPVLTSSQNPAVPNQSITYNANVFGNTPTGVVDFNANGMLIAGCGGVPLVLGSASCTTSFFANGPRIVTAIYGGDMSNSRSLGAVVAGQMVAAIVTVPGAPTINSVLPGDGQATVNFAPPMSDGGASIASYTATCGAQTATGAGSPLVVMGLTNFMAYPCTVLATNMVGDSSPSAAVGVTPQPGLVLVAVQSRKLHGGAGDFDIQIDTAQAITGLVTVEPRTIGSGHRIVFQFNQPITAAGSATTSVGTVASAIAQVNEVAVTVTGIPDNTRATVSMSGANGSALSSPASIGFLVGDVNNTRSVNSSDISGVKARSGQTTTALNFKFDVNASGAVNSSDISAVKARSGLTLP